MFGQSSAFATGGAQNPMKDVAVTQPPGDSISKLAFSPNANYLIAASWDNNVCLILFLDQRETTPPLFRFAVGKYRTAGRVLLRLNRTTQLLSWTAAGTW